MKIRSAITARGAVGILALLGTISLGAAAGVTSHWKDRQQTIDGSTDDWPVLDVVGDDIAVGAANDDHDLYLAVATSDAQRRRQLITTGIIVWLDATGGRKESYGIRIPGGGFEPGGRGRMGRFGGPPPDDRSSEAPPADRALPALTAIELIGPGKNDRRRLELSAVPELAAAVGLHEGTLLYELRLPLGARSAQQPYGIGAVDRPLGLGIETPKIERPEGGDDRREGGGGRGGGGRRGGFGRGGGTGGPGGGFGGGRDGAMRGRDGMSEMKPVKLWTTLTLARGAH